MGERERKRVGEIVAKICRLLDDIPDAGSDLERFLILEEINSLKVEGRAAAKLMEKETNDIDTKSPGGYTEGGGER